MLLMLQFRASSEERIDGLGPRVELPRLADAVWDWGSDCKDGRAVL